MGRSDKHHRTVLPQRILDLLVLPTNGGRHDSDYELECVDVCYHCYCGDGVLSLQGEI